MQVTWTIDIVHSDCTTHVPNGEVCERGWANPTWSSTIVDVQDREEAASFSPDATDDPVTWLVDHIREHIGTPLETTREGTWYGAPETTQDGREVTLAAHASGFTDAQLVAADRLFGNWN